VIKKKRNKKIARVKKRKKGGKRRTNIPTHRKEISNININK
jgi:ribosomal protein L21